MILVLLLTKLQKKKFMKKLFLQFLEVETFLVIFNDCKV